MEKKVSIYKKKIVKEITDKATRSKSVFVTSYSGLKNKELEDLRNRLRDLSSEYLVAKNSLTKKALKDAKLEDLSDVVDGAVGLMFGKGNIVAETKILVDFSKNHEPFKLKGALSEGKLYSLAEIEFLAKLPSREVLLGQMVSAMKSPINNFVFVLKENLRKLTCVLDEISKQKK